jgi:hypothetical protein
VSRRARVSTVDPRDPHLRLPRALRMARVAEVAFIIVTSYFALVTAHDGETAQIVRARLVLEAFAALAVLMVLPHRPAGARIAAMALAAFVLIGCVPGIVLGLASIGGAGAGVWLSFTLSFAACASQAFVLAACLSVRRETLAAPS